MTSTVTIPKKALGKVVKFVKEEIERLRSELAIINEELKALEEKYRISSKVFAEAIQERKEWILPEGSEPDAVEWEALLEQRKRLKRRLKELEELWHQLQCPSSPRSKNLSPSQT